MNEILKYFNISFTVIKKIKKNIEELFLNI